MKIRAPLITMDFKTGHYITVENEEEGRRIDNFLLSRFKTLPNALIYKMIRKGKVRVNESRTEVSYRLQAGDSIKIPAFHFTKKYEPPLKLRAATWLNKSILYEDEDVVIFNKPAGIPVQGGYGKHFNFIDALHSLGKSKQKWQLAHRLDQGTSGCLIIAKHYRSLVAVHQLLAHQEVSKSYMALVKGVWEYPEKTKIINTPLRRYQLKSGERQVVADEIEGKPSETLFEKIDSFPEATLVKAMPKTGRTHQIRVHASLMNHPIAGDAKYGDYLFNQTLRQAFHLKRLFLHAHTVRFKLPWMDQEIRVVAPLDETLNACLDALRKDKKNKTGDPS